MNKIKYIKQMQSKIIGIMIIILIFLIASCQKQVDDSFVPHDDQAIDSSWTTPIASSTQVVRLIEQLQQVPPSPESIVINNNNDTLQKSDTKIIFPRNCLVQNNNIISGNINFQFMQLSKPIDFIRYQFETITNTDLIIYYPRAFYIGLSNNNGDISLSQNGQLRIIFLQNTQLDLQKVFHGPNSIGLTALTNATTPKTFQTSSDTALPVVFNPGTNQNPNAIRLSTTKLKWVAAGKLFNDSTTNFSVSLPSLFSPSNTQVFYVLKNANSVVKLKPDVNKKLFKATLVPNSWTKQIVSISKIGNSYYYGYVSMNTINNNSTVILNPAPMELQQIFNELNKL